MIKTISKTILKVTLPVLYRIKLYGRENIPETGPFILCSNHQSMADMFFIGYRIKRWINWMSKEELHKNPVFARLLKSLGAFPVKRGKADVDSIKMAYKFLDEGHAIGIFPEGTRTDPEKRNRKISNGAALIALKKNVPILPVAIKGKVKLFGSIKVKFGDPFKLGDENSSEFDSETLKNHSTRIMSEIYAIYGGIS